MHLIKLHASDLTFGLYSSEVITHEWPFEGFPYCYHVTRRLEVQTPGLQRALYLFYCTLFSVKQLPVHLPTFTHLNTGLRRSELSLDTTQTIVFIPHENLE